MSKAKVHSLDGGSIPLASTKEFTWPQWFYIHCERTGKIPKAVLKSDPTLHFCPEWDYLLIDSSIGEYVACSCVTLKRKSDSECLNG